MALRGAALWLLLACEPLVPLSLSPSTAISSGHVLHFPQPPGFGDEDNTSEMQCDEDHGTSGGFVFSPDDTDNQFVAATTNPAEGTVADLGSLVHISHACGNTFLAHFGCGANLQMAVDVQGTSELTERCLLALRVGLLPPQLHKLLQAYHRCVWLPALLTCLSVLAAYIFLWRAACAPCTLPSR